MRQGAEGAAPLRRSIQLQFVRQATLASDVIAWFSAGHFSHVEALVDGGRMTLGSYEASVESGGAAIPPGVHYRPVGYNRLALRVICTIPCSEAQHSLWWNFMDAQIGKEYDWWAILGFAFNRNWREPGSWICSELQARALEKAGVIPRLYLAANKITPVALALALSAVKGVEFASASASTGGAGA